MRILVAGPGTGKTTGIKNLISAEFGNGQKILVLSFTNATVSDLRKSFEGYDQVKCHTLHSYALRINPDDNLYILGTNEEDLIRSFAKSIKQGFDGLCKQLGCISYDMMISKCSDFSVRHLTVLLITEQTLVDITLWVLRKLN